MKEVLQNSWGIIFFLISAAAVIIQFECKERGERKDAKNHKIPHSKKRPDTRHSVSKDVGRIRRTYQYTDGIFEVYDVHTGKTERIKDMAD